MLAVAFLVDAAPRWTVFFAITFAIIARERFEPVEIDLGVFVDDQLAFGIRLGLFEIGGTGFVRRRFLRGRLFEFQGEILVQFLLHPRLEIHDRQLQDLHRLDHARSKDHPLLQALAQVQIELHAAHGTTITFLSKRPPSFDGVA